MKKKNNKIGQPLILVISTTLLLFLLSFAKLPIGLLNKLHSIDILSDVREPERKPALVKVVPKDTTSISKHSLLPTDSTLISDFGFDSSNSLAHFYQKLDSIKLKHNKIRIAYFGDSFVEGDEMTDQLRLRFQSLFGGNGIGFVPMQSNVATLYTQVNIKSTGWKDYNFRDNPSKLPLGISGHLFYPVNNGEVVFSPKTNNPPTSVKLYTGKLDKDAVVYINVNGTNQAVGLNINKQINETVLVGNTPVKSIKITTNNERIPFYGVTMDGLNGVYLDNYSFRGNTSTLNQQITNEVMTQLNNYLQYDLVIVHYGINAVEHDQQEFEWFESSMKSLIKNIRKGFGNVPILLVSTSDIGYKYDGKYMTEKGVPYMVATQKEIARNNKVAFWNLYQAMGGENTMVNWVEGDTVFACKDYTHLNSVGAKKVGDLFFDKLMASKKYYQQLTTTKK